MTMKMKMLVCMLLGSVVLLAGCDKDDEIQVTTAFETALNEKYPDAAKVTWKKKKDWTVAEFFWKFQEYEVWYDEKANWLMAVRDEVVYKEFPDAVRKSFEESKYAGWKIDDIEIVELKDHATIYTMEVKEGKKEVVLCFLGDGTLSKVIEDNEKEHWKYLTVFFQ